MLLDEMEKHLHPSWQREIVRLLAREFPAVQFIASTHAPLAAIGSTSLRDECCQLILLQHGPEGVEVRPNLNPPRDRRADQVLTSFLFGLPSTTSDDVVQKIERYAKLKQQDSPDNREEIEDLRVALTETLGTPETELQRTVERAVRDTFEHHDGAARFGQRRAEDGDAKTSSATCLNTKDKAHGQDRFSGTHE